MSRQKILDKYKGLSVTIVGPNGEKYLVTKPLTKTAIEKQLRENKNEYSSFVIDYIRGKEASYEVYSDYTMITFREWTPGGSFMHDPNASINKKKVNNAATAKKIIIDFILD